MSSIFTLWRDTDATSPFPAVYLNVYRKDEKTGVDAVFEKMQFSNEGALKRGSNVKDLNPMTAVIITAGYFIFPPT